jgi:CBS domain-containing protein
MQLSDIMTRKICDIPADANLTEAAQRMRSLDIGALPVRDGNQLVGMITDRDIAIRAIAEGRDPQKTRVTEAMTPDVFFCFDDDDVQTAMQIMEERQIRRLLVVDRSSQSVGIVSLGDLAIRIEDDRPSAEVLESVSQPAQVHQ